MAVFGLPVEIVGGACAGLSASFFTMFELDSDSTLAKALFRNRTRAVITSTSGSLLVGYLVNPLAGLTFELCYYPACWLKSVRVQKALRKLDEELEPGEEGEVLYDGEWHTVKKLQPQPISNSISPYHHVFKDQPNTNY